MIWHESKICHLYERPHGAVCHVYKVVFDFLDTFLKTFLYELNSTFPPSSVR